MSGDIVNISLRATTIVTNDTISIIVPNSEFISSQVINWSHNNRIVRFRLPVEKGNIVSKIYNQNKEIIKIEDIKEKITSNGQTAVDMKVLKL